MSLRAAALSRRGLHEHVQDLALAVDGAPQPEPFSSNHDSRLVEMPLRAWTRPKPTQVASVSWPELQNPASDCFHRTRRARARLEFLHVAVAQGEPQIEPDRVADDLGWELMTSIGDGLHLATLPPPSRFA